MGRQRLRTNIQSNGTDKGSETTRKFRQKYLCLLKIIRYTVTGYSSMSIFIFQLAEIMMGEREVKDWETHSWRFTQPKYSSMSSEVQGHSFHLNKTERGRGCGCINTGFMVIVIMACGMVGIWRQRPGPMMCISTKRKSCLNKSPARWLLCAREMLALAICKKWVLKFPWAIVERQVAADTPGNFVFKGYFTNSLLAVSVWPGISYFIFSDSWWWWLVFTELP